MIFRIDDISINTDIPRLVETVKTILHYCPGSTIMLAVSPITFNMEYQKGVNKERMNEGVLNVCSDHRVFFKGGQLELPDLSEFDDWTGVKIVSHGFIHVDHRLLGKELQEWNILQSCNIICPEEPIFVPPYHKWNTDTLSICLENRIELVKVGQNWNHLGYNKVKSSAMGKYYFHTYDFDSIEKLKERL